MFEFDPHMENLYSKCVPFDESEVAKSESYQDIRRELQLVRKFLERCAPETMTNLDAYVDKYLELVDLECRHYFLEGYRLGTKKIVQLKNSSISSSDNPS